MDKSVNNLRPRTCRECGVNFDGGPRAWYCPRCRAERQAQQNREYKQRKKMGNVRVIGQKYPCEICGKMYVLSSGLQRYCADCAKEHLKEVDNMQSREWNKGHPEQMAEHKQNEKERNKETKKKAKQIKAKTSVIKELREKKGLSKYRLSVMCGMNEKTIAHLEKLKDLSNVKLGTLEKIASSLDMTPKEFFEKLYEENEVKE